MRIISGKWKGHKLSSFKSNQIRPTTDRIKETLFNIIGPEILDKKVLDLFCGTGNLGLEALSRGALSVTGVDVGKDAKKILSKNKELLQVGQEYIFLNKDVFSFLKNAVDSFELIFIDPPFTKKIGKEVMAMLSESKVYKEGTEIFIEYVKGEEQFQESEHLKLVKSKSYGDKFLNHYIAVGELK